MICRTARRGVGNVRGPAPLPSCPTATAPGSPERLAVLAERAARGEQLSHPDDASFADAQVGAPERLRDVRPAATRPATSRPAAAIAEAKPTAPAEGGRPVPGLTLHRGVRVWRAAWKVRGRKVVRYFGRDWATASARYREWAATWPAPLAITPPPPRPRARIIDTPAGPARLAEAARAAGIRPGTLAYRLDVLGWPVAVALSRRLRRRHEPQTTE